MKVLFATLSAALLVAPIAARGRGKSAEAGKGKGAMEEEDPCECSGPITTTVLTESGVDATGAPIFITSLQQAIDATPEGCVLTTPTAEMLMVYPPPTTPIVPIVVDTSFIATCTPEPADVPMGGCAEGWTYLDGSPVDDTVGAAPAQWASAVPMAPLATVGPLDPVQFVNIPDTGTPLAAYYSCCPTNEATCIALTAPATMVPTPSPTKGKNGKSRRL